MKKAKGRPKILKDTDVLRMVDLYHGGMTLTAIGRKFGVSTKAVCDYFDRVDEPRRPRGRRKIYIAERDLRRLYLDEGRGLVEISEMFSVSPTAVRARLIDYGIVLRRPGGSHMVGHKDETLAKVRTAREMRDLGYTLDRIGRELGVTGARAGQLLDISFNDDHGRRAGRKGTRRS